MIINFLLYIAGNALAILIAQRLVPNVFYQYEFFSLVKIAFMLAAANALVKPVLKAIFSPLILITLGLFTLIINIALLWLVVYLAPEFSIVGFSAYFWTMIAISISNFIVSAVRK